MTEQVRTRDFMEALQQMARDTSRDIICYPDGKFDGSSRSVMTHDGRIIGPGDRVEFFHSASPLPEHLATGIVSEARPCWTPGLAPFGVVLIVRFRIKSLDGRVVLAEGAKRITPEEVVVVEPARLYI